jgi:hypothetical protein
MPWSSSDVDQFKKGLSRKQKKKWVAVANGVLRSCIEDGGTDEKCSGKAIKIANSNFEHNEFNPTMSVEVAEKFMDSMLKDIPLDTKKRIMDCVKAGGSVEECHDKEKLKMEESCCEMEIFRIGNHNGDEFTEDNLEEIASNFHKLKEEVRPSLKITHRDSQESLAGLARYGDVIDVFTKPDTEGKKRLYAKVANIPKSILELIKNRRFPERSIEIYPEFKLGTKEGSPVYKNVLKAIALLGHEMPAVTGMEPIKLSENAESQKTICFSESCMCEDLAVAYLTSLATEVEIKLKGR